MEQEVTIIPSQTELEKQFEYVNSLIEQHRSLAIAKVNTEALLTNWEGIMGTVLLIHFSNNRTRNENVIKI